MKSRVCTWTRVPHQTIQWLPSSGPPDNKKLPGVYSDRVAEPENIPVQPMYFGHNWNHVAGGETGAHVLTLSLCPRCLL